MAAPGQVVSNEKAGLIPAGPRWWSKFAQRIPVCLALALVTLIVYWPVTANDFVTFDDPSYVTANAHVLGGLKWANVAWAFQTSQSCSWQPVAWLSHMLDCQLFWLHPALHHLTSVLIHIANTLLLFLGLSRLTGATRRSAVVAALFALHPLHVESVAWVAERKDVLSTFFLLLTFGAYSRYVELSKISPGGEAAPPHPKRQYFLALLFFSLGLMTKPMLVTVPFILLLLDYWPLRRVSLFVRKSQRAVPEPSGILPALVKEKIPFFTLSLAGSVATFLLQKQEGAVNTMIPLNARIANALVSYARYLSKTFWPENLAVLYPYPSHWPRAQVLGAALLLLAISSGTFTLANRRPWLFVGWSWFLGTLVPVIGVVQVGSQSMADRYTYVPSIGLFVLLVWGLSEIPPPFPARARALALATALILCGFAAATVAQLRYWRNTETLWRHTAHVTPRNFVAFSNLGLYLSEHGQEKEAIDDYRRALEINPSYAEAHNNLGIELAKMGTLDEAIEHFRKAVSLDPRLADAHRNLGLALALRGNFDGAIVELQASVSLKPEDPQTRRHLADILAQQGRFSEAIPHYLEALRLGLNTPLIHLNLGMAFARNGQRDEATLHLKEALMLQPNYAPAEKALHELGFR